MKSTDSEQEGVGMELEQYRNRLEQMVEEKSKDLIAIQENLEATNRRQALFIKVLQILQLEPDIPTAMNMALAEIGRYTGVDRLATWENHLDGITYGCTNEWCNDGIEPAIDYLRSMTIEAGKPWFDMLEENHIICTSDIYSLDPFITQMLEIQGVKAIAVFPLSQLGVHFGFLSFNFCWNKQWDEKDVELMSQISQIVSTATKRWQVETSLQLSQRTMQKVLDNINANIFVCDYDTQKVLFANKPFREEAGQVSGNAECWKMLNAGLNGLCAHCPKPQLLDADRKFTGVHFWEDYNPITERWYTIQSMAIKWLDGRWAIMELATDITTRKQVELELILAKEKAEESDRLKSAFLANMSHEIRTPLNAIVGFSEIIALTEDEVEKAEYLNIIQKNSNLLLQLINDILDLSRIESGKSEMNFQLVEMTGLIDEVEKVHRLKMKTGIRLNVMRPDEEIWIMVDRNRITQVLFNFLSNAIKNTHEGAITLGLEVCGEWLKVYVTDTGCGIAKEKLPLIFNRFEKLNDFVQGTGLGLPICQSIVERLGGKISVESEVGVGSTFVMTLPYRQFVLGADGEPVEINAHVERRSDGRKKILIAEDTESNFMQINILLKKDYTISWVTNGEEAVNSFLRERPDLILMDIRMPVMNGIQATEKIRTIDIDLPIVAVTANAFLIEQQQALAAGCNDIIAKPYTYERLKETIIKYI